MPNIIPFEPPGIPCNSADASLFSSRRCEEALAPVTGRRMAPSRPAHRQALTSGVAAASTAPQRLRRTRPGPIRPSGGASPDRCCRVRSWTGDVDRDARSGDCRRSMASCFRQVAGPPTSFTRRRPGSAPTRGEQRRVRTVACIPGGSNGIISHYPPPCGMGFDRSPWPVRGGDCYAMCG